MAPRLSAAGGSFLQMLCATVPILTLLVWFMFRARELVQNPPCVPYLAENGRGKMVMVVCEELNQLRQMVAVFLVLAALWALLAVYLTVYVPRRLSLLQRYIDEGNHKLGDVVYERAFSCGGLCGSGHWGHITYQHVNYAVYPTYVTRRVPVLQHYTRERVAILVLPDLPFSGMPKSDIELDLAASTRQRKRSWMVVGLAWWWFLFCVFAPIFLLVCMEQLNVSFVGRHVYVNWILYSICVGLVIPLFALVVNHRVWTRYLFDITLNGQIAESVSGSSETMGTLGTTQTDIEVGAYKPPTRTKAKLQPPKAPLPKSPRR
jgi:hypothetical protein